ncbi:sensor histidine kinase [Streptomyces sp. NPDC056519]|uniref:sensor histidine kinase n=1 Tax=Streptomyces sp. NPDC056519 TaxID=3345849 RepID=UPI0036A73AF3
MVSPLPPLTSSPRALRHLPHALVTAAAALLFLFGKDELRHYYGQTDAVAQAVPAAYAAILVLALYAPVPALLGSLAVCVGTAFQLPIPQWPWPALYVHAGVLFLLSLRVRAWTAFATWGLTAALTYALPLIGPGRPGDHFLNGTLGVFAAAAVTGVLLRARREAHAEAVRQAAVTAEERARRKVLEERARIARELHDVVAHHMSVISIQAQVASRQIKDPTPELRDSLTAIRSGAVEALGDLRSVLALLRAEDSDDDALYAPQPTLAQLGQLTDTVRATGTTITTETTGTPRPLPPGVELSAYRIIQEAFSNAMRHAPSAAIHVRMDYATDGLTVEVTNTAPTRSIRPVPGAGHGLLGMRERTAILGGRLTTHPTQDGGYTLNAVLPAAATPARRPPPAPEVSHPCPSEY